MTDVLLPLALLYADGCREIRGATKLQKLAFLAQEEYGVEELHEFKPHKYGPFSESLTGAVKALEQKGLVERREEQVRSGNEIVVYSLTERGIDAVRTLLHERDEDVESTLEPVNTLKQEKGGLSLDRLLRYVYKKYPEMTTESEHPLAEKV